MLKREFLPVGRLQKARVEGICIFARFAEFLHIFDFAKFLLSPYLYTIVFL